MRGASVVSKAIVVALLATGCGDFWEEEFDETADDTEVEVEPVERDTTPMAPSTYDVAELGAFSFDPVDCPFTREVPVEVDCGVLTVPESRTGLSDNTIEVAVAVLRTPNPQPEPDPVVWLAGGPGSVALAEHFGWISDGADDWEYHPILANRDLILVDQRGTGYSQPQLWCGDEEGLDECHDRLVGEGVTIGAYSTPENAADIASLRLALELDEWNLQGGSYGTRLALAVVRDHPEGVRSIVLEGVYPPNVTPSYEQYPRNALRAIDEITAACAEQPDCAAVYGDVRALLVEAMHAVDGNASTSIVGHELFDLTFAAMYDMDRLVDIPLALALAVDGHVDDAIGLLEGSGGLFAVRSADPATDAAGMFHAIECREEGALTDVDAVEAELDAMVDAGALDRSLADVLFINATQPARLVCPTWDTGVAADPERAPVASDVPALVLSGRFDPITPPAWGALAAASLTNVIELVFDDLSHSVTLENSCIADIHWEFLQDPHGEPDVSCVTDQSAPPFTLP